MNNNSVSGIKTAQPIKALTQRRNGYAKGTKAKPEPQPQRSTVPPFRRVAQPGGVVFPAPEPPAYRQAGNLKE